MDDDRQRTSPQLRRRRPAADPDADNFAPFIDPTPRRPVPITSAPVPAPTRVRRKDRGSPPRQTPAPPPRAPSPPLAPSIRRAPSPLPPPSPRAPSPPLTPTIRRAPSPTRPVPPRATVRDASPSRSSSPEPAAAVQITRGRRGSEAPQAPATPSRSSSPASDTAIAPQLTRVRRASPPARRIEPDPDIVAPLTRPTLKRRRSRSPPLSVAERDRLEATERARVNARAVRAEEARIRGEYLSTLDERQTEPVRPRAPYEAPLPVRVGLSDDEKTLLRIRDVEEKRALERAAVYASRRIAADAVRYADAVAIARARHSLHM